MQRKQYEWLTKQPIAHRGLYDNMSDAPENSLRAFGKAIEKGYPVELDVQMFGSCGTLAVFHDFTLRRMTGAPGTLEEESYASNMTLHLKNSRETIPEFAETLRYIRGRVPIVIEIKCRRNASQVCAAVWDSIKDYDGPYVISSFNPFVIRWFKSYAPEVVRGQIIALGTGKSRIWKFLCKWFVHLVGSRHADFYCCHIDAISPAELHRMRCLKKKPLLAYTVRSRQDHDRIKEHVDNVFFEGVAM